MTPRLLALSIIDGVVLGGAIVGLPVAWSLLAHAMLTVLGLATWMRGGGATGVAPAVLGLLGPIAILLALPLGPLFARHRGAIALELPFEPPRQVARTGASLRVARMLDGRVHHAEPETLHSLVTIMRHGDVGARRQALETVVRSFQPALSPLIALALTDADQTIRALAAAAAARVGQNLALARTTLESRAPDDPEASTALAALLADHARGDVLLSDSQRTHLREDAVAIISGQPVDADDTVLFEALWATGDYDAIDRLASTIPTTSPGSTIAAWWQAEAAA